MQKISTQYEPVPNWRLSFLNWFTYTYYMSWIRTNFQILEHHFNSELEWLFLYWLFINLSDLQFWLIIYIVFPI